MRAAIKEAHETEKQGGPAIGAVMVKDGEIISVGHSLAGVINDIAQHAEIAAIRAACEKLQTINLDGCILYGTLEPCAMCLSASLWGNLSGLYFGCYADDVPDNPYEFKSYSSEQLAEMSQRWDGSKLTVKGGVLREECARLLDGYKNWVKA